MKHFTAIGLLYLSNQDKITSKFGEEKRICGCESAKTCCKGTANLRICGCGPPIAIFEEIAVEE